MSVLMPNKIRESFKRAIDYAEETRFLDEAHIRLTLDEAAVKLAHDPDFRRIYFKHHPDGNENSLIDDARSRVRINRVIHEMRMERRLTYEELNRHCTI